MKLACLDLGSNTFLLTILEVEQGQIKKVIYDESQVVRLAQGMSQGKKLCSEALVRAEKCLQSFSEKIKDFGAEKTYAVATSAARDAINGSELIEIGLRHNIFIKIVSGQEEARLTYLGSLSGFTQGGRASSYEDCRSQREIKKQITGRVAEETLEDEEKAFVNLGMKPLVIDIGGSSTEIINPYKGVSLDIGTVRLLEQCQLLEDEGMIGLKKVEQLRMEIDKKLRLIPRFSFSQVVVSAGTPVALACLVYQEAYDFVQVHGVRLTYKQLDYWLYKLLSMDLSERLQLKGILKGRADVLPAGLLILSSILHYLRADSFVVSSRGVRFALFRQLSY